MRCPPPPLCTSIFHAEWQHLKYPMLNLKTGAIYMCIPSLIILYTQPNHIVQSFLPLLWIRLCKTVFTKTIFKKLNFFCFAFCRTCRKSRTWVVIVVAAKKEGRPSKLIFFFFDLQLIRLIKSDLNFLFSMFELRSFIYFTMLSFDVKQNSLNITKLSLCFTSSMLFALDCDAGS